MLERGHSGEAVAELQRQLNAAGAQPPLAVDGLFGPKTQAALEGFQTRQGGVSTGRAEAGTWDQLRRPSVAPPEPNLPPPSEGAPRRAPQQGEAAPPGSVPAGSLQRNEDHRRATERSRAGLDAVQPAPGQTRSDAEVERLQRATVDSARRELAAGVRADPQTNRGQRVDQYARDAGMQPGGAWCGYFTGFNYSEAARESGGRFRENVRFHSFQKARSYFEYRNYTNASRGENERLDRLREQHQAEGSTRRYMTLSGSTGQRHAQEHRRPHEVYEPSTLPIRAGDTALFNRGHVGLVESYDRSTGRLVTLEGNAGGGRVQRNTYDLNDPAVRARFDGFGRPARGDFDIPGQPAQAPSAPRPSQAPAPAAPPRPSQAPAPAAPPPAAQAPVPAPAPGAQPPVPPPPAAQAPAPAPAPTPAAQAPAPTPAAPSSTASTTRLEGIPPRPADAMTGSEFLARTRNMSRADREAAILREIESGNVPDFARQMREIQVSSVGPDGRRHTGTVRVMPDYLAIGSNEDFVRIPMSPVTAQRIADRTGTVLPTRRLSDEIYRQADVRMTPQPLPAGPQMMSNDYYARHQERVERQRNERGAQLGELTAGHKKDIVISNALDRHPDRVAIYGWHQPNGRAIQPLSTIHEDSYADYSHGARLVSGTMIVDGVERPVAEVLRDPQLAGLLSDEGVIRNPSAARR